MTTRPFLQRDTTGSKSRVKSCTNACIRRGRQIFCTVSSVRLGLFHHE
jgi:hypothetical protein